MAENTNISWAFGTFNPWMGCEKLSEACKACYAEELVVHGRMSLPVWGAKAPRKRTADGTWKHPRAWDRAAATARERRRIFCASLADVFEDRDDLLPWREDLFRLIEATPNLDWLLLTKRADRMKALASEAGWTGPWPENVWAGVTAESQTRFDERIVHLLSVPARIHFVSAEPLLGPLDIRPWVTEYAACEGCSWSGEAMRLRHDKLCPACDEETGVLRLTGLFQKQRAEHGLHHSDPLLNSSKLDWIIVGGESHKSPSKARVFDLDWARDVRAACAGTQTRFFMKQLGCNPIVGRSSYRVSGKGDDPDEWPVDLRIREVPGGYPSWRATGA